MQALITKETRIHGKGLFNNDIEYDEDIKQIIAY